MRPKTWNTVKHRETRTNAEEQVYPRGVSRRFPTGCPRPPNLGAVWHGVARGQLPLAQAKRGRVSQGDCNNSIEASGRLNEKVDEDKIKRKGLLRTDMGISC